jgi:hypothetical protein
MGAYGEDIRDEVAAYLPTGSSILNIEQGTPINECRSDCEVIVFIEIREISE